MLRPVERLMSAGGLIEDFDGCIDFGRGVVAIVRRPGVRWDGDKCFPRGVVITPTDERFFWGDWKEPVKWRKQEREYNDVLC